MTRSEMISHAEKWIEAWNTKDLDAIMVGFVDDATFASPRALELTGAAEIRGKDALRGYWKVAMNRVEQFAFRLDRIVWDDEARELAIVYVSVRDGAARRACELIRFNEAGSKVGGEALYGSPVVDG